MASRKDLKTVESAPRRSRHVAKGVLPSMTAFGIGLGALLLAGSAALVYHVSSLRSGNGDLRAIADAAEDKSREPARRLVERLGQSAARPSPEPQQRERGSIQSSTAPTAEGLLTRLWRRWFATSSPAPAEPDTPDDTSGSRLLERMRAQQAQTQPTSTQSALPSPRIAPPPSATVSAALDTVLRRIGLRSAPASPFEVPRETADDSLQVSTELAPPFARATFPVDVQPSPVSRQPEPTSAYDTTVQARFLLSEHDLSPAIAPPPVLVPTPDPVPDPPVPSALPTPARQNIGPPPAVDVRRRHATAAECTSVIEQAQLGDLTDRDRLFLQENCR